VFYCLADAISLTLVRRRRCLGPAPGPQRLPRGPRGCHDLGHLRQRATAEVRFGTQSMSQHATACSSMSDAVAPGVSVMSWRCSTCSRRRWPGASPPAGLPMAHLVPTSPLWLSAPSMLLRMSSLLKTISVSAQLGRLFAGTRLTDTDGADGLHGVHDAVSPWADLAFPLPESVSNQRNIASTSVSRRHLAQPV
jgi:hypothetical protein